MDKVAIIHFIGLALFSTHVPDNEGALRALLPRAEKHQTTEHTTTGSMVESHVAAIIYKEKDLLQEIGWEPETVPARLLLDTEEPGAFRMVRLNGERLTFLSTGDNGPVQPVDLKLPRPNCTSRVARTFDAAATVAIPWGKLSTCSDRERMDTRLQLHNRSVITAWAESNEVSQKPARALVLNGDAELYVVNIPRSALGETPETEAGAQHFLAYYTLLRPTRDPNCEPGPLGQEGIEDVLPCGPIPFRIEPSAGESFVNSECSNTAWP